MTLIMKAMISTTPTADSQQVGFSNQDKLSTTTLSDTSTISPVPLSPILWQNTSHTVTLLDIPHSIACAQSLPSAPPHHLHLLSSPALQSPFPSTNEPKSAAARAKLEGSVEERERDEVVRRAIVGATEEVRRGFDGEEWCLPRLFVRESEARGSKKRRRDGEEETDPAKGDASRDHQQYPTQLVQSRQHSETIFFSNDTSDTVPLTLPIPPPDTTTPSPSSTYLIPPNSSFILGDCSNPLPLDQGPKSKFNLILLDPPWPNRSNRRTHLTPSSSATYSTSTTVPATRSLLLSFSLPSLMAPDCLVAIWITNKPAIRSAVLDPVDGIFAHWDVELVQEWVWCKVTAKGECVTPLEGLWRKPWEILLVGRKKGNSGVSSHPVEIEEVVGEEREIKRHVIFGVPDLHSRKPCLKVLLEPLVRGCNGEGGGGEYAALEVFARHLVAGWWSWGNECVKFNWEGFWRDGRETDDLGGG